MKFKLIFLLVSLVLVGCAGGGGDPGPPGDGRVELPSEGEFEAADDFGRGADDLALPEPEFVDLAELYEPWVDDGLVAQTRDWAQKADVEELLPYLDDIVLFKLPAHFVEETGGGLAWYAPANQFFWFDGGIDVSNLDYSLPCLPPGAVVDFYTGGVAHMVLPPDAHPLMLLHELAHYHKHSTDNYDEIARLFGAASYDGDCNVVVTVGEFDAFLPDEWPVTETFEYAFNDFAVTNFYGGQYELPREVIAYFETYFSSD
jgi:hypothetical protein